MKKAGPRGENDDELHIITGNRLYVHLNLMNYSCKYDDKICTFHVSILSISFELSEWTQMNCRCRLVSDFMNKASFLMFIMPTENSNRFDQRICNHLNSINN